MKNLRIAEERKKLGLSQEDLANKLKVSQKSISKYECGTRRPSYETLLAMASLFNVSADYLLGNDTSCEPTSISKEGKYFFFSFDNLLREVFASRIKAALRDIEITEDEFKDQIPIGYEKATMLLEGNAEPTADDLIEISQFLETSIDYLLGQVPKVSNIEKKLLNAFVKLNTDYKDIIIGKTKELLMEQERSFVAADEQLKKTGTDTVGK